MSGNFWDADPVAAPAPTAGKQQAYKMTPDDAKTLTDMAKSLPTKRTLAQRAAEALQVQGTGDAAIPTGLATANINVGGHDLNPIRAAINVAAQIAPNAILPGSGGIPAAQLAQRLQRMDQLNSGTFANMRPDGSGRIMQSEVAAFKQAFPSTASYGSNNGDSAAQFGKEYKDALGQYQFVSNYVRGGKGSAADALAAYDAQNADQSAGGAEPAPASPPGPAPTSQQVLNAALKARSAPPPPQAPTAAPVQANGAVVDIFGRPVQ